jgi:AraC-like DNA-binding protein
MSVRSSIENWFARFKPYIFSYKNGFFHLHYLANSPEAMIGGFKQIPFVKYDDKKQALSAQTLFLNVLFHYREVEEGLFILCSETKFKANVSFKHYYDTSIPADYFCLSLRHGSYAQTVNSLINDASYPGNSWLLLKPGAKVSHHHFKGTTGKYISLYFTNRWLESYLEKTNRQVNKEWTAFLDSGSDHLICPPFTERGLFDERNLFKLLFSPDDFTGNYQEALLSETLVLLSFFGSKMKAEQITERHFLISNSERLLVLTAEQFLISKLYEKFPGITAIATAIGSSETKLKECFKTVHEHTLFQYFQRLQMKKAKELILDSDLLIGQVANKLGYENASKFSSAFKDYHGILPSEVKKVV